ncbi:MAG: ribosome-associated translation inhibitor RaiA [Chloroflexi bacterium]|nr:ribosome-associated translation inhibitor RaiA [Chloroflexota bacterium]
MAQNLEIVGREIEVTDHLRDYVTKKVAKLDRHLDTIDQIRVDLAFVKTARSVDDRYVAQMTVSGKGFILRSEERSDDVRTAMDAAMEKLSRQIDRFKDKRKNGRGDGKSAADVAPELEPVGEAELDEMPVIMRRKIFDLIPMAEEEAIEQMKLLGHDNFFVFYNVKVDSMNVLYRRRDGTYGLIEPRIR